MLAADERGQPLFVVLNAAPEDIAFTLPQVPGGDHWIKVLDTSSESANKRNPRRGARLTAPGRSVLVFSGAAPPAA